MGFRNPPVTWRELERTLSGRARPDNDPWAPADGGDSPAWSRKRGPYQPGDEPLVRISSTVDYAELHCHSNFSFGAGASNPEELVQEALRLDLQALALTDNNGLYGIVRFAEAASAHGLPTVFGAELTLTDASHVVVLARDPEGYAQLARLISLAQLAGSKGAPVLTGDDFLAAAAGSARGHWAVLTASDRGAVPRALIKDGPDAAKRVLQAMVSAVGADNVFVELWDHGAPLDSARNDALAAAAVATGCGLVAANDVYYHAPQRRRLATALAAVAERTHLDAVDATLPAAGAAFLRSGDEQARWFARFPGVVEQAAELGRSAAFDLALVAPQLPPFPCPDGYTEMTWLRTIVERGATERYGPRTAERVGGAWRQIDHELAMIEQLGFAGYFLVVWDIVEFCRGSNILCQGRGSAANSAVCYSLGITNADAVSLNLLFERFLSPERDGPPDIDIDIESGRREEVIQYVYERHGRHHAAQVANVITYRARSSVRDMARALGYAAGQQDAFAKSLDRWAGLSAEIDGVPSDVLELAQELEDAPRHLGIHSGGMVICDRPIIEVCPVEWATMADRSVLQWDKDDCAHVGLVKFDLLGLGMLEAIHRAIDLIADYWGITVDLATLPQEDEVYAMLCRADSIGVFQVESRAQMATLPRLKPRTFYDLVVEVALIRPGPIQGGSVHPYIRRRNGKEPVTYLHPLLENALSKTLGIPLFQEQLMQMAIDVAGFTPAEADELRQAMGSKRSRGRMERLQQRLYDGMAERGIVGDIADEIWNKLAAFANYGFPESHSVSFAYLVYASSWIKYHYPAAFCVALLNSQPMGFYSPHTLVQDAKRHGVGVDTPCVNASNAQACLSGDGHEAPRVRVGLQAVRNLGADIAEGIEAERRAAGPYRSIEDLHRRVGLRQPAIEALATAGAFDCFGTDRRRALWTAGAMATAGATQLPGIVTGIEAPQLPGMSDAEMARADLWATGIAPDGHPTRFVRDQLGARGVVRSSELATLPIGKVSIAGVVTHRQRPATAGGTTFLNLEDEEGLVNIVVSKGCWIRHRHIAAGAAALVVHGRLERSEGVVNVVAERMEVLELPAVLPSRDFR